MNLATTIGVSVIALLAMGLILGVFILMFSSAIQGQNGPPERVNIALSKGKGALPLWLFFLLNMLASAVLILLGFFLLGAYATNFGISSSIAYPGGALFGVLMSQVLFCELLSLRCPRCSGRAFQDWGARIKYTCRDCGYTHDTGINSNSGGGDF